MNESRMIHNNYKYTHSMYIVSLFALVVQTVHEEDPVQLQADDLEKEVEIVLSETETIWMLDIPGCCVAHNSDEAETVKKNNEVYAEV